EDLVDEEGDLEDDDQLFVPQPPTPDLLKSTRRERADEHATSCHGSPETQKRRFEKNIRREKRRSYTTSILISPNAERPIPLARQKSLEENTALNIHAGDVTVEVSKGQLFLDRNRDGKGIQRRQSTKGTSLEENTALNIHAGDVTVEVSKGQLFLDRNRDGKGIQRRQSTKEYSSQDLDCNSAYNKECAKDSAHIISLHNVGDLFPGTEQDVSYV
ncbi:unnamed protein product, partial [Strongylus vulgaris]